MNRGARAQIAIPAQGLIEFKDQLNDILERYKTDEPNQPDLPESQLIRAENKTFYFDCGSNLRGVYLKITEARQNRYRTSITIPEKYLQQFKESLNEFIDKTTEMAATLSLSAKINDSSKRLQTWQPLCLYRQK